MALVAAFALAYGCSSQDSGERQAGARGSSGITTPTATSRNNNMSPGRAGLTPSGPGSSSFPALAGSSGGAAGGEAPLPDGTCATGAADTIPVVPTVWLVVDGSSSMTAAFGNSDRWDTLRATLMDPGAVVDSLQALAKFGMVIYSGGQGGECTKLVTVEPALNNHANLLAMYPEEPIGQGTPTDKALDHVVTNLPVTSTQVLDATAGPVYVVLATDGQPNDMCGGGGFFGGGGGGSVEQQVIDVTTRGTQAGVQMFVISLAGDDAPLQTHLEQVAAATVSQTPPFVPATQQELVQTFRDIVGSASCQIDLKGMVEPGMECAGSVTLNGADLECDSDNGWKLIDPDTFSLTGTACDSFTNNASTVHAMFPCEVFIPE